MHKQSERVSYSNRKGTKDENIVEGINPTTTKKIEKGGNELCLRVHGVRQLS